MSLKCQMKIAVVFAVLLFKIIKDYWNKICPKFKKTIELKEKHQYVFEITCFYKLPP